LIIKFCNKKKHVKKIFNTVFVVSIMFVIVKDKNILKMSGRRIYTFFTSSVAFPTQKK